MKFTTIALLLSTTSAISLRHMKKDCTTWDAQHTAGKKNDADGNCVIAAAQKATPCDLTTHQIEQDGRCTALASKQFPTTIGG